MPVVQDLCQLLDQHFPPVLAEEWDNTGLLVGDRAAQVARVMTCLTLTPESVAEAVDRGVDLVVSHHPLPFRPLKRFTTCTTEGGLLWRLARGGVSVYSPHTAFDSAGEGINALLCRLLELADPTPLAPVAEATPLGAGRVGELHQPTTLDAFAAEVKSRLSAAGVRVVGEPDHAVRRVAVACGSGASFLDAARQAGADTLLTGEATFHNCLAAKAAGVALVLPGHYASERFAVENLAEWLADKLPGVEVWASTKEADPLRTL